MGTVYTVKAPNGKTYQVEAPEGASQEQIFEFVKTNYLDKETAPQKTDSAPKEPPSYWQQVGQNLVDIPAGFVRGSVSIGDTLLTPIDALARKFGIENSYIGRKDRREMTDEGLKELGADPESGFYKTYKTAGEVAGTAGIGGLAANSARVVLPAAYATKATPFLTAVESGGMSTGLNPTGFIPSLANFGIRTAGGATSGALGTAMVNPEDTTKGAAAGAVLPHALRAVGGLGSTAYALVAPFTDKGQNMIRDKLLRTAAKYAPQNMNTAEIVPGSKPTLAEATGNANLARIQNTARDINPNSFVEREQANSAARNALFENVAGDANKLDYFRSSRDEAGKQLYRKAMQNGIDAEAANQLSPQIQDLMSRPAMIEAAKEAKRLAANEGIKITEDGSIQGLHYTKLALDNQIGQAIRNGSSTEARILLGVKDKLDDIMTQISPAYKEASATYAEMSKPVNQMEFLQSLKLTDSTGNITLNKVNSALNNIYKLRSKPGANPAKQLDDEQITALKNIRDDLLRQANLNLGTSRGSNTFQNIATNNLLETMLPGEAGKILKSRISTPVAQIGQVLYNKPNEAIRDKFVEALLNPDIVRNSFNTPNSPAKDMFLRLSEKYGKVNPALVPYTPYLTNDR